MNGGLRCDSLEGYAENPFLSPGLYLYVNYKGKKNQLN